MTIRQLGVNTSGQTAQINNFFPIGSIGNNLWIGNGGQLSAYSSDANEGSYNVSLGNDALLGNITGAFGLAIGARGLLNNTTGKDNLAIGFDAMNKNQTGLNNVAIGSNSLYNNNINGNDNVAIGFASLYSSIGYGNVGIGASALYSNTSDQNTAIGYQAGRYTSVSTANTGSRLSVYIGAGAKSNNATVQNEIVIGSSSIGNGSNTTTIGNNNTTHTIFQYGKTLVGYSAAQDRGSYALQVNGQIYATNAAIATSDARLKERITPLASGLKEVMALRPCTFDFKQGTEQNLATGRQVGFIAQEVASVLQDREWVSSVVQEAGGNLGIAETKLLPLLVKAVQEQQAQIEKLNAQLSLLQSQISQLERKAEATKSSAKKVALK